MLELIKSLLDIELTDTTKDTQLTFYLNKSKNAIKNYLNIDLTEQEQSKYEQQIVDLAMFYYNNKDWVGIVQGSQGSRSATVKDGIPQQILDTLPLPKVRVF